MKLILALLFCGLWGFFCFTCVDPQARLVSPISERDSLEKHPAVDPLYPPGKQKPDLFFTSTTGSVVYAIDRDSMQSRCILKNGGAASFVPVASQNFEFIKYETLNLETGRYWEGYKNFFYSTIAPGDTDEYNQNLGTSGRGHYLAKVEVNFVRAYTESNYKNNVFYYGFWYADTTINSSPTWYGLADPSLVTSDNIKRINKQ